MTNKRIKMLLWSAAGFILSLMALLVILGGFAGITLVTDSEGISQTSDAVMHSIHSGDWQTLQTLVSGNPNLEPVTGESNTAESLIWETYRKSLQWSCTENFEIQGGYVTQSVTVTCLDIPGVTDAMTGILQESPAHQENQSQALYIAAEQVLQSDAPSKQRQITFTLVRENGCWRVLPDSALLALLSGFVSY